MISKEELESGKYVYYMDRWVKATDIWPENHESELPWYYKLPIVGRMFRNRDEEDRQRRLKNGLIVCGEQRK